MQSDGRAEREREMARLTVHFFVIFSLRMCQKWGKRDYQIVQSAYFVLTRRGDERHWKYTSSECIILLWAYTL